MFVRSIKLFSVPFECAEADHIAMLSLTILSVERKRLAGEIIPVSAQQIESWENQRMGDVRAFSASLLFTLSKTVNVIHIKLKVINR